MPVTISPATGKQEEILVTLERILSDLPKDHYVCKVTNGWLSKPESMTLWWAVFNDRVVGFVLVEKSMLKAIAVHPATRSRGIGRQLLLLIMQQYSDLVLASDCQQKMKTLF